MKSRVIVLISRLLLGGLLLAAGWPKVTEPGAFIRDIWNFHLVPESWAYWIAAGFPYLEIVAALALITGLQRRGAHVLIGGMLAVFLVFHVSAWARGLDTACGCFGTTDPRATAWHPLWWIALVLGMGAALVVSARAERIPR